MSKRSEILTNASRLFLDQGYRSTSIQSIADAAGISKGAVYLYFKSKEEIILAIFQMIEDEIWSSIESVNRQSDLSAREKYHRHIVIFYDKLMENLQLNQMVLNNSGLEISERFYNHAREYRYRLQLSQEQSLLNIYGEPLQPWLTDIVASVNGILQEMDVSIVLDGLQLESEKMASFICDISDFLVQGVLSKKPEPLFKEENRRAREEFLSQIKNEKQRAVSDQFLKIIELSQSLTISQGMQRTLQETLELLDQALQSNSLNKTLIKALLSNLNEHKELRDEKGVLANLLDIGV